MSETNNKLEIKRLSKRFGEKILFENLSLTVDGPAVLWAPSGWGKTTLLRILMGLEAPTSGSVEGVGRVGAVFQEDRLCPQLTAEENVALVLTAEQYKVKTQYKEQIRDDLIQLGLDDEALALPARKLSGGQNVIGAVINIILDPIFIFVFHLGVRGAALATVLSQAVGAIWILRFLSGKKTILHLRKENFRLQKDVILPCLGLGISTFVMLSTESILSISFTSSLSRYGGDLAVGAMTIITSVSQLATLPLQGICQGGQPIMSYNFGAGNKERVKKAFFTQFKVCTIFTSCFWLIMLLFPKLFAGIFSNNTDLITYTAWALRIYMAGIFSLGFQVACQQSFMALGQAKVSLLLACLRKLILLIPLIFILPLFIQDKVFAVFLAEPISDIVAAAITTITFMSRFNGILNRGKV